MSSKVLEIFHGKKPRGMIASLEELMDDLENDRVSDFIIISRCKVSNPDDDYDGHEIKYNWMGRESTLLCLGMLEYMATKIKNYIWDRE